MTEEDNLTLVQQFYAAFETGNVQGVLSTLADDVRWLIPGPKDIVPFVGQRRGHEQVADAIRTFTEIQNAELFELRQFVAEGDEVIAFGHYRWGIKATGQSYETDFAHAFTITNGRVSRFQEYVDTQAVAAAYHWLTLYRSAR